MRFRVVLGHISLVASLLAAGPSFAQLLRVQCPGLNGKPAYTALHPDPNSAATRAQIPAGKTYADVFPGGIKCQEISGGDGYATMADGTQTYLFGFGPLSGLDLIARGQPGTLPAADFNHAYSMQNLPGVDANNGNAPLPDPTYVSGAPQYPNGGILDPAEMMNIGVLAAQQPAPLMAIDEDDEFFLTLSNVGMIMRPDRRSR